jgi:hypothetical protein
MVVFRSGSRVHVACLPLMWTAGPASESARTRRHLQFAVADLQPSPTSLLVPTRYGHQACHRQLHSQVARLRRAWGTGTCSGRRAGSKDARLQHAGRTSKTGCALHACMKCASCLDPVLSCPEACMGRVREGRTSSTGSEARGTYSFVKTLHSYRGQGTRSDTGH